MEALSAVKVGKDSREASQKDEAPAAVVAPRIALSSLGITWRPFVQRPWVWALGSAFAVMLIIVSSLSLRRTAVAPRQPVPASASLPTKIQNEEDLDLSKEAELQRSGKLRGADIMSQRARDGAPSIGAATSAGTNLGAAQMIERTASLSLTVKEMDAARTTLAEIAKRHHGYFAELNTEGQSEAGRTLTASLRIPADELETTLAELRKVGQPGEEKQGGEEVSQQYVDLKARLDNARHTEKRLTELLTKRADKLKDVLDVERELAGTREEIERMEAQQRNMESRVCYASIDLKLREEYKPALNLAPPAAGTRMRNALVDGYHSAVDSALNVLLFVLQAGPSTLFWLLILFFPARWSWRKLRVAASQKQSLAGAV